MNRVLITGATSGLGMAIAARFSVEDVIVYVHGRKPDAAESLLVRPNVHFISAELQNPSECEKLATFIIENSIDCLISNAGIYDNAGSRISSERCRELINVNLIAPLIIINRVYEHFKAMKFGTIVSINSLAGSYPDYNEAVYSASKHGLAGFIKALQMDCLRFNVRILDYYPGATQTRMTMGRAGYEGLIRPSDIADRIAADVLMSGSFVPVRQEFRKFATSSLKH